MRSAKKNLLSSWFSKSTKKARFGRAQLGLELLERREMMTALAAPTFKTAVWSDTQINLSWNAVAGATSYSVEDCQWINGAWSGWAAYKSPSNSGADFPGLSPSTYYCFSVQANNSAGNSPWANSQMAETSVAVDHPKSPYTYSVVNLPLFGSSGRPSFSDVQQGIAGDCWLMASLASTAVQQPRIIESMFTSAGTAVENGVSVPLYNVRFYNSAGQPEYVTVDTELPAGGTEYDRPKNGVLWAALAEKAYAQANGLGIVSSAEPGLDSYAAFPANKGADPGLALHAITGNDDPSYALNPSNITSLWNQGCPVVLCSLNAPGSSLIVGGHAYAVIGCNASGYDLYNPWGTATTYTPDGNHEVYGAVTGYASAAYLEQNFGWQAIGANAEPETGDLGYGDQAVAGALAAKSLASSEIAHDRQQVGGSNVGSAAAAPAASAQTQRRIAVDELFAAWEDDAQREISLPFSPSVATLPALRPVLTDAVVTELVNA
jgi:hypothetical protein